MLHTVIMIILCTALTQSGANPAWAASNNGNLSVSAVVPAQALITSGSLNFGILTVPTTTRYASSTFQVSVSPGTAYSITLDAGLHALNGRRMSAGNAAFRPYSLYKDPAHTKAWGDAGHAGTFPGGTAMTATGTGSSQSYTVYGVSPGQAASANPPGNYYDIVTITIYY